MGRVVDIWRSWSPRRRFAVVAGAAVVAAAIAIAVYLALKRPEDVSNPGAAFSQHKQKTVKPVDWPLYGLNLERTRYLPAKDLNPPFRSSLWSFQAGKLLEFQPIVVKGTLYFLDKDAVVYALSTDKGHVEWRRKIGALSASSPPAVAFGRVYLGGLDGRIYSFTEEKGELAWSHSTGAEVYPSPAVADTPHSPPTVYAGSQDKRFYALDAKTGAVRWEHPMGGVVLGSSSVVGETVYVAVIGPNIGTFGYHVKNGKKVFYNDQGEYN